MWTAFSYLKQKTEHGMFLQRCKVLIFFKFFFFFKWNLYTTALSHCFQHIYHLSPSLRHTHILYLKSGRVRETSNAKYRPLIKSVRQNMKWHHKAAWKTQADGSVLKMRFKSITIMLQIICVQYFPQYLKHCL